MNPKTRKVDLSPARERDPQAAVRVGNFERALEAFNAEISAKTAQTLAQYDAHYVRPLRRRLDWLELPWYKKAIARAGQATQWTLKQAAALRVWWTVRRRGAKPPVPLDEQAPSP